MPEHRMPHSVLELEISIELYIRKVKKIIFGNVIKTNLMSCEASAVGLKIEI